MGTVDNSATSRTAITIITAIGHVSMKSFVVERTEWRFLFLTHPLGAAKSVMNVLALGSFGCLINMLDAYIYII